MCIVKVVAKGEFKGVYSIDQDYTVIASSPGPKPSFSTLHVSVCNIENLGIGTLYYPKPPWCLHPWLGKYCGMYNSDIISLVLRPNPACNIEKLGRGYLVGDEARHHRTQLSSHRQVVLKHRAQTQHIDSGH